jgi:hypothetical protein
MGPTSGTFQWTPDELLHDTWAADTCNSAAWTLHTLYFLEGDCTRPFGDRSA